MVANVHFRICRDERSELNTLVSLDGGHEWHGTPMMKNPSRKCVGSALMSKYDTVQIVDKLLP
jgi:hypothetical protein